MFSITIPQWVLLVGIGIPVICMIALILGLVRAKLARKHKHMQLEIRPNSPGNSDNRFTADIYKLILDQQIDAVFLSLSTIIETEKLKLKALIGAQGLMEQNYSEPSSPFSPKDTEDNFGIPKTNTSPQLEIAVKVDEMSKKGMTPKEIAREMRLSLSEVVLALRISNGSQGATALGGQLEAVA